MDMRAADNSKVKNTTMNADPASNSFDLDVGFDPPKNCVRPTTH